MPASLSFCRFLSLGHVQGSTLTGFLTAEEGRKNGTWSLSIGSVLDLFRSFNSRRKKKKRDLVIVNQISAGLVSRAAHGKPECLVFHQISKYVFVVVLNLVLLFTVVLFFFVVVLCCCCFLRFFVVVASSLFVSWLRLSFVLHLLFTFLRFLCFSSSPFFRLCVCSC